MAKHKDVDHLFKDGLEDYTEKPSKDLEAKMAAMIGVSAIAAATGTAAAGTTVAASTASVGTATATGLAQGGLLAKAGAVVKLASIKGAVILKSLGIIKTVATLAVIGTATTATVLVSEEIKEKKSIEKIDQANQIRQKQLCNTIHSKTTYLHIEEQIPSLATRDMKAAPWIYLEETEEKSDDRPDYLASIDLMGIEFDESSSALESKNELTSSIEQQEDANHSKESFLAEQAQTTRLNNTNADSPVSLIETMSEDEAQAERIPLRPLNPILTKEVDSNMFVVEDLIMQAPLMAAPTMSTLEKGFYLPNYIIQADFSFMPMTFSQQITPTFSNDSVSDYSIQQAPQFSYQIGAAMRIQKKRSPWFLQAGINYQHLKEKIDLYFKQNYVDFGKSYWNVDTSFNIYINPPNIDTIFNYDSTFKPHRVRTEESKQVVNSYQFLEIPLRIGYQYHDYGKKWSVEASTGLSFAFHLKSTGYTYNNSGYIIDYKDVKQRPLVYCYYVAHVAFNYHLDRFSLFAEPSLKYQINKKTIDQSPYESKYLIYGLKMGIRIQLFKNAGQP